MTRITSKARLVLNVKVEAEALGQSRGAYLGMYVREKKVLSELVRTVELCPTVVVMAANGGGKRARPEVAQ